MNDFNEEVNINKKEINTNKTKEKLNPNIKYKEEESVLNNNNNSKLQKTDDKIFNKRNNYNKTVKNNNTNINVNKIIKDNSFNKIPKIIDNNDIDSSIEKENDKLLLGLNEKKRNMYLNENSRYLNTLILGTKGTGKTSRLLPFFVEQDIKNKECGVSIIVTKYEMAYNLYTLAKKYKRDVIILKPSINNEISTKLLWSEGYSYDYINENIINYKEAIKKKKVVIIDMEILKHKSDGLRTVAMLLLQLQLDIQETDITLRKPHFLYIDDAQYYLPFLEHLLNFSDEYNLGITLFFQSRNQFIKNGKDYTSIIDNNIRNIFLLNNLNQEDICFYENRFKDIPDMKKDFLSRKSKTFIFEIIDTSYKRKFGIADFEPLENKEWDNIIEKAKKMRMKLLKQKREEVKKSILESIKKQIINNETSDYSEDTNVENLKKELISKVPIDQLYETDETPSEPMPIDLSVIDNKDDEISEKKELSKQEKKDTEKFKDNIIAEIVRCKEKNVKRRVSTKIFNKMSENINYCNDDFTFTFDENM